MHAHLQAEIERLKKTEPVVIKKVACFAFLGKTLVVYFAKP